MEFELKNAWENGMSYEKYYNLIKSLLAEGKTTGSDQKESYLKHARLNFQRMKRVYRTTNILEEVSTVIKSLNQNQKWMVISEGWCGDAAQSLPILARLAEASEKIELRILLRDENLDFMDLHLTNGARSIPKLIAVDMAHDEELFTWGPRPAQFQKMVMGHKQKPVMSNDEFNEFLHKQYTLDKTVSVQKEISSLIMDIKEKAIIS